ncbi:MAG: response regulator [Anaerolineae bacterium]
MSEKIDVFIVDDDTHKMQYFQSIVNQGEGMRCIGSTTSSQNAVDVILTIEPDVVLVDYALYPVSGFEIMAQLHEQLPDVPIVLLGGRASFAQHATEAGAAAYLPMPITPRDLLDTIQRVTTPPATHD